MVKVGLISRGAVQHVEVERSITSSSLLGIVALAFPDLKNVKAIFQGALIRPDNSKLFETLDESEGDAKVLVTGSTQSEIDAVSSNLASSSLRVIDDLGKDTVGLPPSSASASSASILSKSLLQDGFGFASLHPLPSFKDAQAAQTLLHRLATDYGIIAVMKKRRIRVPRLSEMYPDGKVGVDPVCILGLNKNMGEEIFLRLRTDDLLGFRRYDTLMKTLWHELSHCFLSEHTAEFYNLVSELEREGAALDWTRSGGHTLGNSVSADFWRRGGPTAASADAVVKPTTKSPSGSLSSSPSAAGKAVPLTTASSSSEVGSNTSSSSSNSSSSTSAASPASKETMLLSTRSPLMNAPSTTALQTPNAAVDVDELATQSSNSAEMEGHSSALSELAPTVDVAMSATAATSASSNSGMSIDVHQSPEILTSASSTPSATRSSEAIAPSNISAEEASPPAESLSTKHSSAINSSTSDPPGASLSPPTNDLSSNHPTVVDEPLDMSVFMDSDGGGAALMRRQTITSKVDALVAYLLSKSLEPLGPLVTLAGIVDRVLAPAALDKFKTIKVSNAAFQQRIGNGDASAMACAIDILTSAGFRRSGDELKVPKTPAEGLDVASLWIANQVIAEATKNVA